MSEPEEIDLKVWMAQVNDTLGEIDTLIAELSERANHANCFDLSACYMPLLG
jgi:hypothetical protein